MAGPSFFRCPWHRWAVREAGPNGFLRIILMNVGDGVLDVPPAPPGRYSRCHRPAGGSMPRPYGVPESRRGDPCGRPERRGRRSLRVSVRSTPPQPVGAIHELPAAAKRRVFRCLWHRGNGPGAVPYDIKNPPFPEKRGISITICSYLYAERKLATSRAVLLDGFQAKSIRHEFARRGSLQKSPGSEEPGDEAYWVNLPITGSWRSA